MAIAQKRLDLLKSDNENIPEVAIEDLLDENKQHCGTKVTLFIKTD